MPERRVSRIRALIFDFDGLILDTEVPAFQSWQEVYREHAAELTLAMWRAVLGGSGREIDHVANLEQAAGRTLDGAAIHARRQARKVELIGAQEALPGVTEYLRAARELDLKLAVVSSSPHDWVEGHLAALGIRDAFDVIICAEDAPRSKPHPDLYLAALAALDINSGEAIAFEDSPNGITAAQAAGIYCICVPNAISLQMDTSHAHRRLDSLASMPLTELLAAIEDTGTPPENESTP